MNEVSLTFFRICNKCGCAKPKEPQFFQHLKHKNRIEVRGVCRTCFSAYRRKYRAKPEIRAKESASWKRYYEKNAERLQPISRIRTREWTRANPEKKKLMDRAYRDFRWKHFRDEERLKGRVKENKRRTSLLGKGEHSPDEVWQMYEDQHGLCAYCEIPLFGYYEVDHMIPISRGGRNDWTNLAIACMACNRSKWAYTVEEFFNQ